MSDYLNAILDQTQRALWSLGNVIDGVPEHLWDKCYCGAPLWKHIYHTVHSLDRWMINPAVYDEPVFHLEGLDNLDMPSAQALSRELLQSYYQKTCNKILAYLENLTEEALRERPKNCKWDCFTLILAQHRHFHAHMGMLMGFLIADAGLWPRVLGLEDPFPPLQDCGLYF